MSVANHSAYQNIIEKLKAKVSFFTNFSYDEMASLLQLSARKEFHDKDIIFTENSQGSEMYVILTGSVKISKKGENNNVISLAELNVGDCFGEMSVIDGSNRSAQAAADGDVILLALHENILSKDLNLAYKLFKNFSILMANRLRVTNKNFAEIISDEAKGRIKFHEIIKKYAEHGGSFENSNLRASTLMNLLFSKNNLKGSMFVGAHFTDCRLNNNVFEECNFIGSKIENNSFNDCNFSDVNFSAALFDKVVFRNCTFDNVTLRQLESLGVAVYNNQKETK